MDDFGTGYSSLGYLRSFPFDKIKIDQSFIHDLSTKEDSVAIIRAVVGLSSSLGITTTAEGVETKEQLARLTAEGCNEVQGFLFRTQPRTSKRCSASLGRASRPSPDRARAQRPPLRLVGPEIHRRRGAAAADHAGQAELDMAGDGGRDAAAGDRALADIAPPRRAALVGRALAPQFVDGRERLFADARDVDGFGRVGDLVERGDRFFGWLRALLEPLSTAAGPDRAWRCWPA